MNPTDYQNQAARTECVQAKSSLRMSGLSGEVHIDGISNSNPLLRNIRLNHAIIGLAGEVGELASVVQKHVYFGKPLDTDNLREEVGDVIWYVALLCNAMGFDLGQIMTANIAKLKARYPEKWSEEKADDANRDRAKEAAALNAVQQANAAGLRNIDDPKLGKRFLDVDDGLPKTDGEK